MQTIQLTKKMTGKMTGMQSLNTSPLRNPFCLKMSSISTNVCSKCYSQKLLRGVYANAEKRWALNGEILSTKKLTPDDIPFINASIFRLSAHGEIINPLMYKNYLSIVEQNPGTTFALWTKRKDIVCRIGKGCTPNLILIYSSPKIDSIIKIPKYFDKVFSVYTAKYAVENNISINCGEKKCIDCRTCYSYNNISYINEVLKQEQHIWRKLSPL